MRRKTFIRHPAAWSGPLVTYRISLDGFIGWRLFLY